MAAGSTHPAFVAADEQQRWRGNLKALWAELNREARAIAPSWAARILPHGARVALKVQANGQRILKIYRREAFKSKRGPDLWTTEVLTFAREFDVMGWTKENDTVDAGPLVTFTETARARDFFNAEP